VLKAVARDLFHQSVEMSIIEQNREDIGCNQSQEHTAFRVQLRLGDGSSSTCSERLSPDGSSCDGRELVEFNPDTVLLRASNFCSAFPYHIIFDRDLRIRQCGDLIQKHSSVKLLEGTPLTHAFSIVHPKMVLSIDNIRKFINAVFLLAIVPGDNGRRTLLLKGQMIWISDTQNMIFIGSPRLTSLNELMEMNVYLADIPLYDVTRELVLLNQQRIAEIDIAKRLDETTAELKKTSQALEVEKCKTETLLHQMLPRKVANALTHGQKVEAEKFDQVTILFSDIVTFTNIAAACSPMDIVNMLNDMYQRFDQRTSQHNVYKVETIGDAYMIVSGVPEQTTIHAQPVANFALDMVEDAGLVKSPATGLPLQIRVGIHTGPVVAGVVGVKMPRYCLFGDTVNTASRMESHGVPGRIHLSPSAYEALKGWGYAFKQRGEMEVKGKGKMSTYFLCGHLQRRLKELEDEYSHLEIHQDNNEQGILKGWPESNPEGKASSPCNSSLNLSDECNGEEDQRPTFYASSDSVESLGGRAGEHTVPEASFSNETDVCGPVKRLGRKCYERSNSSPSTRFMRKKKISRTSLDGEVFSGADSKDADVKTKIVVVPSSTKTSLEETTSSNDCIYVSGSFKNTYGPKQSTSVCSNSPDILATKADTDDTTESIPDSNGAPSIGEENLNHESSFQSRLTQIEEAHSVLLVSSGKSAYNCRPIIAKSETFPISSANDVKSNYSSSTSHQDLKKSSTGGRGRKKKKDSSKLCQIA
ncbi:guanylate cyclase soluble subunit beta-2, partial [Biomphalaria pfeifferi]